MKITIDTDDVEKFLAVKGNEWDEWYGPFDGIHGSCIVDFLDWINKKKAVEVLKPIVDKMWKN